MTLCRISHNSVGTKKIADVESLHPLTLFFSPYFVTLGDSFTGKQRLQLPMLQMQNHLE